MSGRDIALVLVVCVVWALNFLVSGWALREFPPFLFTAMRFALLVLPLAFFLRAPAPGQWPRLLGACFCIGVLHFGLSFLGLALAGNLSSPAILAQSYVPMTALLGWWLLGERFAWRTGLAIGVSFCGVLVLGLDPLVLREPASLVAMLASALAIAVGTVLMKPLRGVPMLTMQAWTALVAVLPLLAISAVLEPGGFATLREASGLAWFGAAYAAFASSLLGHGLYYVLIQRHPVAQVMPWLLLVPIAAVGLGIAFFGDQPGPRLYLGGAMVLGGVLVIALRTRAKQRTAAPAEEL